MTVSAGAIALGDQIISGAGVEGLVAFLHFLHTATPGVMELACICVDDIVHTNGCCFFYCRSGLFRYCGFRGRCQHVRSGRSKGVRICIALDGEGHTITITGADDRSLQIGAVDLHISITQAAQSGIGGMTVGVVLTHGDDGILGHDLPEEGVSGGVLAAVVSDLKYGAGDVISGIKDTLLFLTLGITGEQEGCIAVCDTENDGHIV